MGIKHVLVHVEPGLASEGRLKYAIALARHYDSRLTGLTVTLPPSEVPAAMMGDAQLLNVAMEAAEESAAYARAQFDRLMRDSGLRAEWRNGEGNPVQVVSAEAGRADLLIVGGRGQRDLDGGFYLLDPADVVMTCGRPVLVVPEKAPGGYDVKRVVLAWKNTREAARALYDALPFLLEAEDVLLTEITAASHLRRYEIPISDIAEHLRDLGVAVTIHKLHNHTVDPGDLLVSFAVDRKADLIVAGAYGHSRTREWALGGVTASLLNVSPIPCLLSH